MNKLFFFFFFFFFLELGAWSLGLGAFSLAQPSKIDSLNSELHKNLHDTARVNALNALGWELKYENPDTAIILSTQALRMATVILSEAKNLPLKQTAQRLIATSHRQLGAYNYMKDNYSQALQHYFIALEINERSNDKNGIATTLRNIGIVYDEQDDYHTALDYYFRALKMDEELGNKNGIAKDLGIIGGVYYNQADYPKALDYYFRALKMDEELGNKNGIAIGLSGIGLVFYEQGDYPKALDYYFKALKMYEELGNKNAIAIELGNIGIVYNEQGDYPKALDYYFRALKMREELGAKKLIASTLGNIGNVYNVQAETHPNPTQREELFNQALDYYFRALKMREELGAKKLIASTLGNIGSLYTSTGKFVEAEKYLKQALMLGDSIEALVLQKDRHENLSRLYDTLAQLAVGSEQWAKKAEYYQLAYEHYKQYSSVKDSLFNEEKSKDIGKLEARHEFDKQLLVQQKENEKKEALSLAEIKRQKVIAYSSFTGFALVLALAFVIFRSYRQKKLANTLLQDKNRIIGEKNKDITDSIRYAQNIQEAILPSEEQISKYLSQHFVYFQPKDIVSGDFYWLAEAPPRPSPKGRETQRANNPLVPPPDLRYGRDGLLFIALCDCTGHGVPGAFVSMIGNQLLNQSVIEKGIETPGEILTFINNGIKSVFSRQGALRQANDGMDMALCAFDNSMETLEFSGANNPLFIIRNGELTEVRGDKQPIGGDTKKDHQFTNHKIKLEKGDTLYLFSDGYNDQFGGPRGKKFMMKQFKELLLSIQEKDMQGQKAAIRKSLADWKGVLGQVDDICVIGIRV